MCVYTLWASGMVVDGDGSGSLASRTVSIRLTNHPPDNAIYEERVYACMCFVLNKYVLHDKSGWAGCFVHVSYNCWEEQQLWI